MTNKQKLTTVHNLMYRNPKFRQCWIREYRTAPTQTSRWYIVGPNGVFYGPKSGKPIWFYSVDDALRFMEIALRNKRETIAFENAIQRQLLCMQKGKFYWLVGDFKDQLVRRRYAWSENLDVVRGRYDGDGFFASDCGLIDLNKHGVCIEWGIE